MKHEGSEAECKAFLEKLGYEVNERPLLPVFFWILLAITLWYFFSLPS